MMLFADTHERLADATERRSSSNRAFGNVLGVFFLAYALWPFTRGHEARWWAMIVAACFLSLALMSPRVLAPLNRIWTKLGYVLQRITNPVLMGMLFYIVVTPVGLVLRAIGKDVLHLRRDPYAKTYWHERQPPGPLPHTLQRQF